MSFKETVQEKMISIHNVHEGNCVGTSSINNKNQI